MDAITLGEVARRLGVASPAGAAGRVVRGVSTDSRTIGDGALFVALAGERFDGATFVRAAFERGATAAVVGPGVPDLGPGRPLLRVADPADALVALAAAHRAALPARVVAITGSAGKTTTKDLVHHLLSTRLRAVRAEKSFNNHVGVPLTLLGAGRADEAVVVEVGTSGPGEIARLAAVARPDVALITCIAPAHLAGLGSIEGVAREKLSLLAHLGPGGQAVLNGDDLRLRAAGTALRSVRGPGAVSLCGFERGNDWRGELDAEGERWRLETWIRGRRGPTVALPGPGRPLALAALLALATAERLGVPVDEAARALLSFQGPPGRFQLRRVAGVALVDDTYNANPASVAASLETFAAVAAPDERVVVLGAMRELGPDGPRHHRGIGRFVARLGVARLVTVGEDAAEIARGAVQGGLSPARCRAVAAAEEVLPAVRDLLAPGRAVLFKASRAGRLERALEAVRDHLEGPRALPRAA